MSATVSDQQISAAVCASIRDGTYPEEESVVTAELSTGALENMSQILQQAREDVKTSIRELSRINASEVDGWIAEAKQLQQDLEDSEKQKAAMGSLAARQQELDKISVDANYKVTFLKRELAFNGNLTNTLGEILELRDSIDHAREKLEDEEFRQTLDRVEEAEARLSRLEGCQRTGLINLLRAKIVAIREDLAEAVLALWSRLVQIDHAKREIHMSGREGMHPKKSIEDTVSVLADLDLLGGRLLQLKNDAEALLFRPRIGRALGSAQRSIEIKGPYIRGTDQRPPASLERLLADVSAGLNYFSLVVPGDLGTRFVAVLAPSLIKQLIAGPLASSIPPDLSGAASFAATLSLVQSFAATLGKRRWPGGAELLQWVESAPQLWLKHRSNTTLSSVRQLLSRGIGKPRSVERVETQQVPIEEAAFEGEAGRLEEQDDWNNSWADEETDGPDAVKDAGTPKKMDGDQDEDEDEGGAWGFDDDENETSEEKPGQEPDAKHEDAEDEEDKTNEDWGWGDDAEQPKPTGPPSPISARGAPSKVNNQAPKKQAPQTLSREVTLRESYHITAIPEQILEILVQVVDDAESLTSAPANTYGSIQPAGEGLYALPSLILSMFRACAPNAYTQDLSGNMYLYNDSLYLAEQLRAYSAHQASRGDGRARFGIDADIAALEKFGKASYGKEMEAQRTIVRDMLDGAQGFAHSTTAPHTEWCENAIRSTTDWLASLHTQWRQVLAPSALYQSLGSLLNTVVNKIMVEIQDLADISDPESKRLAGLCQRIEGLDRLFLPDEAENDESDPSGMETDESEKAEQRAARAAVAASVYAPGLLRFQWLSQILEASLADIRYWWTESELSGAYASDEIVDLIEALFADSDHRRKAIQEIRRGRQGR